MRLETGIKPSLAYHCIDLVEEGIFYSSYLDMKQDYFSGNWKTIFIRHLSNAEQMSSIFILSMPEKATFTVEYATASRSEHSTR